MHGDETHFGGDKQFLDKWSLAIHPDMAQVQARVLDPPRLHFNAMSSVMQQDRSGQWRFDAKSKRYSQPGYMLAWSVAVCSLQPQQHLPLQQQQQRDSIKMPDLANFLYGLESALMQMGCSLIWDRDPEEVVVWQRKQGDIAGLLTNAKQRALEMGARYSPEGGQYRTNDREVDLILVILPNKTVVSTHYFLRLHGIPRPYYPPSLPPFT